MRRLGSSVLLLAGLIGAGCKPETANRPPVARAGDDQQVFRGDPVTLDGSGSFDPDEESLLHSWTQLSGPTAVPTDAAAETLSFVSAGAGSYVFQLVVTDAKQATSADVVAVEVRGVLGVTVLPADGSTGIAARQPVVALFDAPIRPWTAPASLVVEDVTDPANPLPVLGNVTLEDDGTAVVFLPVVDWSDQAEFRVTVTEAAIGLDGARLRDPVEQSFVGSLFDVTPPTVVRRSDGSRFVSPGDGVTDAELSTFVEILFSEPVDAAGVLSALTLNDGSPVDGDVFSGAGGTRAFFVPADTSLPTSDPRPLAAATSHMVRVADTLMDEAGNGLDGDEVGGAGGDFTSTFQTRAGADATDPGVVSISPLRGALGVSVKLPLVVTFSEPVEPSTVAGAIVLTSSGTAFGGGLAITGTLTMSHGNTVAMFQPSANLATGVLYAAQVGSGITDLSGNPLAATFDSFFVTGDAPPPEVLLTLPVRGPIASSFPLTVQGEDFVDGATVFVPGGGVLVNSTTFISATELQADVTISPSAALGARAITVINPDGQSGTGLGLFEILSRPPDATSLSPAAANQGESLIPVSLLGANFQAGATVAVSGAGVTVNSVTFVNAGQLDLVVSVAAGAATGARSVTVTHLDAQFDVLPDAFTVRLPAPTVASISPASGGQGENLFSVVISGSEFQASPTVNLGSGVLGSVVAVTATSVTVNVSISGTATLGPHDVTVTNQDGQSGVALGGFTVLAAPPTVVSSSPAVSQGSTTVPVAVNGSAFQCAGNGPTLAVRLAGAPSVGVTVDNAGPPVSCSTSSFTRNISVAGTAVVGLHDLRVTNPDGQFRDGVSTFEVGEEIPVVTSLSINQGRRKQTLGVTVNGSFFQTAPTAPVVSFGPGIAVSVDSVTATQIQTTITITDAAALTTRNVVVTNADGQVGAGAPAPGAFTVQKASPDLVSLGTTVGNEGQTLTVTLNGDDFDCLASPGSVPTVSFGTGVTPNSVTCPGAGVSENSLAVSITVTNGAGAGLRTVTVINPEGGTATDSLLNAFQVRLEAPTINAGGVTPAQGRRKATFSAVVAGTEFQTGATVSFGADIAVSVGAVTPTSIGVTLSIQDVALTGARDVTVTNPDGQSFTRTGVFTVQKASPDLVSLGTTVGNEGQTLTVTLNGDDFDCLASPVAVPTVSFGAGVTPNLVTCPGAGVSENSLAVSITVTNGAGAGLRTVTVTNPEGGTATDSLVNAFQVRLEAPTINVGGVTPAQGRRKAALSAVVAGTEFQTGATVSFGADIAVSVSAVNSTSIGVTLSIQDVALTGARDVTVTNPDDQSFTRTGVFTVQKAAPDLVSLGTTVGNEGQTLAVTLNGDDFDCLASPVAVPTVSFGAGVTTNSVTCPGAGVSENSLAVSITITNGAGAGPRTVTAINPEGGTATDSLVNAFQVRLEAPTINVGGVTPAQGRRKATLSAVIAGTEFQTGATVSFGADIAVSVSAVNSTSIGVTLSIQDVAVTGARAVTVTNPDGQAFTRAGVFTVQKAAPDLVSLGTTVGNEGQTLTVTLNGDDFDCLASPGSVPTVSFGTGVTTNSVTCPGAGVSENSLSVSITIVDGAGAGLRTVTVINPEGGTATDSLLNAFQVRLEAPTINVGGVAPAQGRRKATLSAVVSGTEFQTGATVSFGADIAVSVSAVNSTSIGVTLSIQDVALTGARAVTVTNPDGQSFARAGVFTVQKAAPDLVSLGTTVGNEQQTLTVTLNGDDFDCLASPGSVPTVSFGAGVTTNSVTCPGAGVSENSLAVSITVTNGAGAGLRTVTVINPEGGTATDSLLNAFEVRLEAPTINVGGVTPPQGRRKATLSAVVAGTEFLPGATVSFGADIAVSVSAVNSTSIGVTLSIQDVALTGPRDVTVTNPDGQTFTRAGVFTVQRALPTVTGLSPPSTVNQGQSFVLVVNGIDFDCTGAGPAVEVRLVGFASPDVTEDNATFVACSTTSFSRNVVVGPTADVAVHDIRVTNPDGGVGNASALLRIREEAPSVSAFQDSTGAALPLISRKSTYVNARVIGNFFLPGASVSMGTEVPISSTTRISATRLDITFFVSDTATLGGVTITVSNPDGQQATNAALTSVRRAAPSISTVVPAEGNEGTAALAVTVTGDDFQCNPPFGSNPGVTFGAGITATVNTCTTTTLGLSLAISSTARAAGGASRNVTVTNNDTQSATGVGFFGVLFEKPVVSSALVLPALTLSEGRRGSSLTVRVNGSFFQDLPSVPTVSFGSGIGINAVTFVSSTSLEVAISISADPFLAPLGSRNVIVTNTDTQSGSLIAGFTVLRAVPTVASITPNAGSQLDPTIGVTITGDHFDCSLPNPPVPDVDLGDAGIVVDGESCGLSTSQRATSLTANVTIGGASVVGAHSVSVLNPGDSVSGSGVGLFTVREERPTVATASPNPRQGETRNVTVTGAFFQGVPPPVVTTSAGTVNSVAFVSATELTVNLSVPIATVISPPSFNLRVTNVDGQSGTGTGVLSVDAAPAPTVASYSPSQAALGQTRDVTLTGTNFQPGTGPAQVVFNGGGITVNSVIVSSCGASGYCTTLTANITVAGGASLGARSVTVSTVSSPVSSGTGAATFLVTDTPPTVTTVAPSVGTQGTAPAGVVISGAFFQPSPPAASNPVAEFCATGSTPPCASGITVTFVASTTSSMTVNLSIAAGAPVGARDVYVTNADGGRGLRADGFTVTSAGGGPVITSIVRQPTLLTAPNRGIRNDDASSIRQGESGVLFHLQGTDFQGPNPTVSVSGTGITVGTVTFVSPTRIDVLLSASCADIPPGLRDVTVTNPPPAAGNGLSGRRVDGLKLRNGVVINEVATMQRLDRFNAGARETLEIFNGSNCQWDITNWRLDFVDTALTGYEMGLRPTKEGYSAGSSLAALIPGGYAIVEHPDNNGNNMQDNVFIALFSVTGRYLDHVEVGDDEENDLSDGGPAVGNNGVNGGLADEMVARCPNGSVTDDFLGADNDVNDFYQNELAGFQAAATPPLVGGAITGYSTAAASNNGECPPCADGGDNDADGWIDMLDPGCTDPHLSASEADAGTTQCNDGIDNADPEDALADELDPDCFSGSDNNETR